MGCREVSGLWILGRPYNVGIVGWCLMSDIQVFWFFEFFQKFVELGNDFVDGGLVKHLLGVHVFKKWINFLKNSKNQKPEYPSLNTTLQSQHYMAYPKYI